MNYIMITVILISIIAYCIYFIRLLLNKIKQNKISRIRKYIFYAATYLVCAFSFILSLYLLGWVLYPATRYETSNGNDVYCYYSFFNRVWTINEYVADNSNQYEIRNQFPLYYNYHGDTLYILLGKNANVRKVHSHLKEEYIKFSKYDVKEKNIISFPD